MKLTKAQQALFDAPVAPYPQGLNIPENVIEEKKCWYSKDTIVVTIDNYVYTAEQVDGVLIITIYRPNGEFSFRVWQWPDKNMTRFAEHSKPSEASIGLVQQGCYNVCVSHRGYYIGLPGAGSEIDKFLDLVCSSDYRYSKPLSKKAGDAIDRLDRYQSWLREQAVKRRHDKIRQSISSEMLEIRELPKAVEDWITRGPLKHSRYIFYRYKPNKHKIMEGTCSYCLRDVKVKAPRHQGTGICPHCHSHVTYIADGKFAAGNGIDDRAEFAYFQPTSKGYCIRFFEVRRKFTPQAQVHRQDFIHEHHRVFYDNEHNQINRFDWGNFKNTGHYEWCREYSGHYSQKAHIYPGNLAQIVKGDERWKYMPLSTIARECGSLPPDKMLSETDRWPWLEYLVKLKLYKLAGQVIRDDDWDDAINRTGRNIREILGFKPSKDDLKDMQKLNPDANMLILFRSAKESTPGRVSKETLDAIRWWNDMELEATYRQVFAQVRIAKARKYIEAQCVVRKQQDQLWEPGWYAEKRMDIVYSKTCNEILSDWQDYIGECAILDYDLADTSILFPHDLVAAHTRTSGLVKIKVDAEKAQLIKARAQKIDRMLKYEQDGLLIRAVSSITELVREGKSLHHCVGGYAERHAKGATTIMVIRMTTEPNKPFYTLECNITEKSIVQCRGLRNCSMTEDVKKFVGDWQKKKLQSPAPKQSRERVKAVV